MIPLPANGFRHRVRIENTETSVVRLGIPLVKMQLRLTGSRFYVWHTIVLREQALRGIQVLADAVKVKLPTAFEAEDLAALLRGRTCYVDFSTTDHPEFGRHWFARRFSARKEDQT